MTAPKTHPCFDGEKVRAIRERMGILPADVAKRVGVEPSTVLSWELGTYEPRASHLARLSAALDADMSCFFTRR